MSEPALRLPAVHRLLAEPALAAACAEHGRPVVRDAIRTILAEARRAHARGDAIPDAAALVARVLAALARRSDAYPEVLNATGVLIHTNLGRAPHLSSPLPAYLALELDLDAGGRGERLAPVTRLLTHYFGSEAALVVGNNAAALLLLLAAHAAGHEVIVSRGELVEIGGSFRLPELMAAAGARLVEVGCTNRTHVRDYAAAISDDTAGILVVHRSNFTLTGFVATPELGELAALARTHRLPLWVDQGSGCHLDLAAFGLRHEVTVQEILAGGADVVMFSGDKLLGGPQAGVLVGSETALAPMRRHPLRRALRPDKSALAALAATLEAYLAERPETVPLYRLLAEPLPALRRRAQRLAARLRRGGLEARAVPTRAVLGGGTTPDHTLPSWGVRLPGEDVVAGRLRRARPPVVSRIEQGGTVLDLRALFPEQDAALAAAVAAALGAAAEVLPSAAP
jgi:L-seryl-tRNA(Ser) seleniumtransferase